MQPLLPGAELVRAAGVAEREHLLDVADLREAVGGAAADPLGRRVGGDQLRVRLLERAQLAHQVVVLVVADRRVVELVVAVVGLGDQPPQLRGALVPAGRRSSEAAIPSPAPSASRSQSASRSISPWSVRSKWIGVIATRPRGDRVQVGPVLVLVRRLEAVDLVAPAAAVVLLDQLQLVVVEALAEPGDLDPLRARRRGS